MLNLVLYQTGWFACVFGAAYSRPWTGIAIGALLVGIHLWLTTERQDQIRIIAITLLIGMFVDGVLLNLGVYSFSSGMLVPWLPPLWMSMLWIQFAITLRYSLKWLSGRYVACALFGCAAPLAFVGGERLGAVLILSPRAMNLLTLGVFWCVAIPLLVFICDRLHVARHLNAGYRGITK